MEAGKKGVEGMYLPVEPSILPSSFLATVTHSVNHLISNGRYLGAHIRWIRVNVWHLPQTMDQPKIGDFCLSSQQQHLAQYGESTYHNESDDLCKIVDILLGLRMGGVCLRKECSTFGVES